MFNRIENKYALVTGATSGIGEAIAHLLAISNVNLILVGRREDRLERLAQKLKNQKISITTLNIDVSNKDNVEATLSPILKNTSIDILINNAGLALGMEPLDQGNISNWEQMIDTNIKGLLYVTRLVMKQMRENNSGHILNLGSIAGESAYAGGNVYCATKSAVHMLTEAMNIDVVGTKIRIGTIAPGAVDTEFSDVRFGGDKDKRNAVYEGYTPLSAEDIANLALYILNTPEHVNIQHTRIMPTAQRNPYTLDRKGTI